MKKQPPIDHRSQRACARLAAREIRSAWRSLDWALAAAKSRKWKLEREANKNAKEDLFMAALLIHSPLDRGNPANFLRLVADALDGKLKPSRPGDCDDKIKEVMDALILSPSKNKSAKGGLKFTPFSLWKFKEALARKGIKRKKRSSHSWYRLLKRLGYSVSPKRGRPKKK